MIILNNVNKYFNKNRKNQELDRSILKTSVQLFVVEKCLSNSFRAAAQRCHKMLGKTHLRIYCQESL